MQVRAHAASHPGGRLEPFRYEPAPLADDDVEIAISHCGVCHSDLHLLDDAWKMSTYPLVPGHEIVGRVVAKGRAVSHLGLGARVGVGWQRSACLACARCLGGHENTCAEQTATCVKHHGGFADRIRTDGRFAFPIPDGIDDAAAAPLLCGGVTVYAPLRRHGVDATKSVGVVGIGGLGHLAILFARAFGCEITAFSSSADKREAALRMGAHDFVASNDARALRPHFDRFDLIVSTVHVRLDWTTYLQTLKPNGTLCFVGAPPGLLQIPPAVLLSGQRSITASEIGSRAAIREMLAVADRHRIAPEIEVMPMGSANEAIDKVRANRARYRMVLAA
jgi:uncharacterized zinc-type alcohol dehydrogenase-like protein